MVTVVLAVLVVAAVVGLAILAGTLGRDVHRGDGLSPARVERGTPVAQGAPLAADVDIESWAERTAEEVRIPARGLAAYGAAEHAQRASTPECRLSWTTLAGIARIESDHGRVRGSELDADGVARPHIVGVALDGSAGVAEIRDTDGGRLDGDVRYDRAVGPMQFLPSTWARYGGGGNPHQIDDAALAAAAYLCAQGRDTASGDGWWDGVLTYNRSTEYARLVWAAADRYAGAVAAT